MARIPCADLGSPAALPLVQRIVVEGGSDLRELVSMRIAHLNGAPCEAPQHAPIALKEGLTPAQLAALPAWGEAAQLFTPLQGDVLRLCDAMTRDVHVAAPLVQAVRERLGERRLVEQGATIASYNMVSRFLDALQIHADDPRP